MKIRKSKEIVSVLLKKGFEINPKKDHHEFYYLIIDGKKHNIYTYISHGKKEYDKNLLSQIKKQLKFDTIENFENFLDCPFTKENYINMLTELGLI
jgi:predicted RNA binding protein YcfA (HicA-like mRNA interferase family)